MEKIVWARAWAIEQEQYDNAPANQVGLIRRVLSNPAYSIWWQMSDLNHAIMKRCETMVKLLCKASFLKDDDCRLKKKPLGSRMCTMCELGALENVEHMVMQCPANNVYRNLLYNGINEIAPGVEPANFLNVVMGKFIEGWDFEQMVPIWEISVVYVVNMYYDSLRARQGIG